MCQSAVETNESGGKAKNIAQNAAESGESQATMGAQIAAGKSGGAPRSSISCTIE